MFESVNGRTDAPPHARTDAGSTVYCRFGNVRENLIFANIREFVVSRIQSPC